MLCSDLAEHCSALYSPSFYSSHGLCSIVFPIHADAIVGNAGTSDKADNLEDENNDEDGTVSVLLGLSMTKHRVLMVKLYRSEPSEQHRCFPIPFTSRPERHRQLRLS